MVGMYEVLVRRQLWTLVVAQGAVVLVTQAVEDTVVGVHEGPTGQKKRFSSWGLRRGRPSCMRSAFVRCLGISSFFHLFAQTVDVAAQTVRVRVAVGVPVTMTVGVLVTVCHSQLSSTPCFLCHLHQSKSRSWSCTQLWAWSQW